MLSNLRKIFAQVSHKLQSLFTATQVDESTMQELERILIEADVGIHTTRSILTKLRTKIHSGEITQGTDLKQELFKHLTLPLTRHAYRTDADVYLLVGVNGSGKTTFCAKLASHLQQQGKKVLLIAADTFRAAATDQLQTWANRLGIELIKGSAHQDPASVVFAGCEYYKRATYQALIIDTAGRLQTKVNLMHELAKIRKSIAKQLPNATITTLLTIDSLLGQNSFDQAKLFKEASEVNGIVLTKIDGTSKGGIIFSLTDQLEIPIAYLSFGEAIDQMSSFDAASYVDSLLDTQSPSQK
jgi:fused signal recognition particle receptor